MKSILLFFCACLLIGAPASAQLQGLGRGKIPGTTIISASSGPLQVDNLKSRVNAIAPFAGGYTLTLPPGMAALFSPAPGGFSCVPPVSNPAGDMVLIIQMKGAPAQAGLHQSGIVTNVNTTANTITVCNMGAPILPFSSPSATRMQVIRVREYTNLTLNSGEITCDPWNESTGTGGVLCFLVRNIFNINGGVINGAAKGFDPFNVSSWGQGGAGVPGMTTWTPIGNPAPTNMYVGCNLEAVTVGQDGGGPDNTILPGITNMPLTPTVYNPGPPNYYLDAVMGHAGYYPSGYRGGDGAGGGGVGGQGANSLCGTPGQPGYNGDAGGDGGDAGKGARGGGIVMVKANVVNRAASVSYPCISARGQDGDAGRSGGPGGQGGAGGQGGVEDCNLSCLPGGDGGRGGTGDPADGGDGSNSGAPGMIWVAAYTITGLTTANLDVNAGAPGIGGPGGLRWTYGGIPYRNTNCGPNCDPTSPCNGGCTQYEIRKVCDRDKAFCLLAAATSAANHTAGNNGIGVGYDYNAGTVLKAVYDIANNTLIGIERDDMCCIEYQYLAPLYCQSNQCEMIFRKLAFSVTGQTSIKGQIVNLAATDHLGTCNTLPAPPTVYFKDQFGRNMMIYYSTLEYIEDLSVPGNPRCYMAPCSPIPADGQGQPGRDGFAPPNGAKEFVEGAMPANPQANGIIHNVPPGSMYRTTTGTANVLPENKELKLYPQPASGETKLLLTDDFKEQIQLSIYDINGRLLRSRTETLSENQALVTIDLSALSAGLYTLKVTNTQNKTSVLKLVVE